VRRWQKDELLPLQSAFFDTCRSLGFDEVTDHNHPDASGVGPWPMNTRDTIRVSTAIGYLLPARNRLNLTIRPHCLVNKVLIEDGRAVGLEVECGGEMQRVYGKRITLSAGAVASPAILLRSGIGPKADLLALGIEPVLDLPGVGANLIDHPAAGVSLLPKEGVCDMANPVVQMGVRYTAPDSAEFNDMQLYMISQVDLTQFPEAMAVVGAPMVFGVNAVLQRPRSRGRLSLTSADPHVQPAIDLNYVSDPEDMRRMVEGIRLCWQVAQAPSIAQHATGVALLNEQFMSMDEAIKGYINMTVTTLFHPVGTAKMGPDSDETAVVDQQCRVRGIDNLRVVDASVMTNIPRANTNLTCIMIGEKVSDWMRDG
jgi:choline dehydrogenase